MAYDVLLTEMAELDIGEHTAFIAADSPAEAEKWLSSLEQHIRSLAEFPGRFPLIPEAPRLKLPYRSFVHYSHRVIYRVDERASQVYIVRVYHGARMPLSAKELA